MLEKTQILYHKRYIIIFDGNYNIVIVDGDVVSDLNYNIRSLYMDVWGRIWKWGVRLSLTIVS